MISTESGQDIQLYGKNGDTYAGKVYTDKNSSSAVEGQAITCLSNSHYTDDQWQHHMNSIYNVSDATNALKHFKIRDDISHLIIIPHSSLPSNQVDHVDNLTRNYLHS